MNHLSNIKWLVSDWHFGESRLDLMCRPFASTEAHDEALIAKHNSMVSTDDWVLCLGDVTHKDAPGHLPLVARLNGHKILIRGNHDEVHSDDALSQYFVEVIGHGGGVELEHGGNRLYATHYPTCAREDRFNIVGHVHGAWRVQLNMLNVGVDVFDYAPCPIEKTSFFIHAINHVYDRDVWAAYEPANAAYRGLRGLASSYFPPKPAEAQA